MYHDIVSENDTLSGFQNTNAFQYKIEESLFEKHVQVLIDYNVYFTFDDGGISFYSKAAPILEKYGKIGICFVSTKYIDTPGFLTSNQIKELSDRGHIISSHSHSHPENISSLSNDEIYNEWYESISILNKILDRNCVLASIPNGYESKNVFEMASRAGLKTLFTSSPTTRYYNFNNVRIQGRFVVLGKMSTQDVLRIVSNNSYRQWLSFKWEMLNILKKLLGTSYESFKLLIVRK